MRMLARSRQSGRPRALARGDRPRVRRVWCASAVAAAAVILALSGCDALEPHASRSAARVSAAARGTAEQLAQAARTHELPTPAPPQHARGAGSPVQAVGTFARIYINWTAQSVAGQMAELARASVGQARSEMELAAAQTARDPQLRAAGIANRGMVESVAPLAGTPDRYVVVTLESTSATDTSAYQGLAAAWHVTVATVIEQSPGRWVVSNWQPES